MAVAFGQANGGGKFGWVEQKYDNDDKLGVATKTIIGAKKTVFNSVDFGTIVLAGYAPAQA